MCPDGICRMATHPKTLRFCHQDGAAIETGHQFQGMLAGKEADFVIITYQDFITAMQQLDLSWERREFSMMLWARYCGIMLSDAVS